MSGHQLLDVAKEPRDESYKPFDDFVNRLEEGLAIRKEHAWGRTLWVYGHYFYTLLRGYFKFPSSLPGFVDDLYSLVSRALEEAEIGHLGFGQVVDPPFIYVFRLEKVSDDIGRSYGHFHFIKVLLEDYKSYALNPLDFEPLFLDHRAFVEMYVSGKLEGFTKPGPVDVSVERKSYGLSHDVEVYRVGSSYVVLYEPSLDIRDVAAFVFSELEEVYHVNVMIGFPLDLSRSRSYLVILPKGAAELEPFGRAERVGLAELRSYLRALVVERYRPIFRGLTELPQRLKHVENTDRAREILSKTELAVAWMDSVGLGNYFDYSETKGLIQKLAGFLEKGEVDKTLLDYPFVIEELKEKVNKAIYNCLVGLCSEDDTKNLIEIAMLKSDIFEESFINTFAKLYEKAKVEKNKLSLRFIQFIYKENEELARKTFALILRKMTKSIIPFSFKNYSDLIEGTFDKEEFVKTALLVDRRLAEEYEQERQELERELEEECKKIRDAKMKELEGTLLKRIFKEA